MTDYTKLIERLEDAAEEWAGYVEVDTAPKTLPKSMAPHIAALQSAIEVLQAENSQLRTDLNAELQGNAAMRMRLGAKDGETMLAFAERLAFQLDAMGKGEPVGWFVDVTVHGKSVGDFQLAARKYWGDYSVCQPLYAAPKALAPLSRDDVKRICAEADYTHESAQSKADFINGIRHGEKAHGIGGTP